jgi:hypothetical protein
MKSLSPTMRRIAVTLTGSAILAVLVAVAAVTSDGPRLASAAPPKTVANEPMPSVRFNKAGELLRPTGYRRWTFVGTPLTPNDMNGGKAAFPEFHNVYMDPAAYDHYAKTGEIPDGAVLVKELVSVGAKQASSGKGYFMGDFIGLEVSMKDKARFQDEPGNWAFFSFGHEYPLAATAKPQPAANCNACHGGLADEDYIFTQYYPVLRAAKDQAK